MNSTPTFYIRDCHESYRQLTFSNPILNPKTWSSKRARAMQDSAHAYYNLKEMAVERSGTLPKRRSWGKPRHKEKVVNIDHMDVAELTGAATASKAVDPLHPEALCEQTLLDILTMRKIPTCPDEQPSRERLLYLFRKYVSPQPQRRGFWRRRRGERIVATEMEHVSSMSLGESWELPLERKRYAC